MTQYLSLNDAALRKQLKDWQNGDGLKQGILEYTAEENQLWPTIERLLKERDDALFEVAQYASDFTPEELTLIEESITVARENLITAEVSTVCELKRMSEARDATREELYELRNKVRARRNRMG